MKKKMEDPDKKWRRKLLGDEEEVALKWKKTGNGRSQANENI